MSSPLPINIAVVGAGPAGVFTADNVIKQFAEHQIPVRVDLFERLPVPFGLVRYGVAPDHPRIKGIIGSLHNVLDRGDIRLVAGVDIGTDIDIETLRSTYDGVILTTGANSDAPLSIPGVELSSSFGASAFVSWYDGHPDAEPDWALDSSHVAVIGAGNVALDITRMLVRQATDLVSTDVPQHVYEILRDSKVTDVHVFARRGPAEAQFSPVELRELGQIADVDIVVDPADMVFNSSSEVLMKTHRQRRQVADMFLAWSQRDPATYTASRRVHLHFMQAPVEIEGTDRVEALTVERTRHLPDGSVKGTGELLRYRVGQVYRAVGYASSPIAGVPFNAHTRSVPHIQGRVINAEGQFISGLYASGWIKRGPVGLIGSTKSDSRETVNQLMEDTAHFTGSTTDPLDTVLVGSSCEVLSWDGWLRVDEYEQYAGKEHGRGRVKVYRREELTRIARGQNAVV